MTQDQATAILIIGALWVTFRIFQEVNADFPIIKHLGYWFCALIAWVGLNVADSISESAYDQYVSPLLTGYTWFLAVYGIFMFIFFFKDMLMMLKDAFKFLGGKLKG